MGNLAVPPPALRRASPVFASWMVGVIDTNRAGASNLNLEDCDEALLVVSRTVAIPSGKYDADFTVPMGWVVLAPGPHRHG